MKKYLLTFIIISFLLFSNKQVSAINNYYFNEDFAFSLNNSTWISNPNNGDISFNDSRIILSDIDTKSFPYITSNNNIFPQGNFSIEWKFKYLPYVGLVDYNRGTGVAINDVLPLNGIDHEPITDELIFNTWYGGGGKTAIGTHLCEDITPGCEQKQRSIFLSNSIDIDTYRTIKIDYIDSKYTVYYKYSNDLNFEKIFTSSETNERPNFLWLGSPLYNNANHRWSDFSVDYIRIKQLPDKDLNVPFFSQNDTLWASDTYDHLDDTIDNKGCALTSAAMLLAYHGIDITPNNDPMNPKTLNEWLINKIPQEGLMGNAKGYTGDGGISWIAVNQLARYFRPFLTFQMMKGDLQAENDIFGNFNTSINNNSPEILWVSGNGTYWSNWGTHFIVGRGYDSNGIYINDPEEMYNYIPADYPVKQRLAFIDDAEWEDWGIINIHYPNAISLVVEDADGRKLGEDKSGNSYNQIPHGHFVEGNVYGGSFSDTANNIYLYKVANPTTYKLWVESNENVNFNLEMHSLNTDNSAFTNTISNAINNIDTQQYSILFANNQNNTISLIPNPDPDPDPSDLFKALEEYVKNAYDQGKIKSKTYRNLLLLKVDLAQWLYNRGNLRACEAMLDFIEKSVAKSHKNQIDQSTANEIIILVQEIKESLGL